MAFRQGWQEIDGPWLLSELAGEARTSLGRARVHEAPWKRSVEEIRRCHDGIAELLWWEHEIGPFPIGGVEDVSEEVARAARGGMVEPDGLRRIGVMLSALDELADRLATHQDAVKVLAAFQPWLVVAPGLSDTLRRAFDATGALSGRTYPELAGLRGRIQEIHREIRALLEELVRGDALAGVLQDRFVTQRGDRYVLPIMANADQRAVGIVHGVSNRGQTLFVEPHGVVERNNALRIAEAALEEAEHRILRALSMQVGGASGPILRALDEVAELDALLARALLSKRLEATRPEVGASGVVRLRAARHPMLALSSEEVVANDIALDADRAVLVVSGPNTGGKTVVLKTLVLCAGLTAMGVWLPVAEGSRCDLFTSVHVIAGDRQDVTGEASTFSSHLAALAELLSDAGQGVLGLVDEIASGTDPIQGAALAASTLEAAAARGARVVVTTHLSRLKTWALTAPGVEVAGMSFVEGRPTFRMTRGVHGESHALEVARRRGFPSEVVDRALQVLSDGDGQLARTMQALEEERSKAERRSRDLARERDGLARAKAELSAREQALTTRAKAVEERAATSYLRRLEHAERAVAAVVAGLQQSPNHGAVAQARTTIKALRGLAAGSGSGAPQAEPVAVWRVGDRVRLPGVGGAGRVVGVGRKIRVQTDRGMTVHLSATELRAAAPQETPLPARRPKPQPLRARRSRSLEDSAPTPVNTLDLRGQRVDEGLETLDRFLAAALSDDHGVVFVLHGHGTGALKEAVRQALRGHPAVARFQPARADQGGDAHTVVALRPAWAEGA